MTFRHRSTATLAALLLSGVALHAQPSPGPGGPGEPRRPPGAGAQESERPAERPQGRAEQPARSGPAAQGRAERDDAQPGQRDATPGERRSPAAQTQEERREQRREDRQTPGAAQGRTGSDRDTNETPATPRRERTQAEPNPAERSPAQRGAAERSPGDRNPAERSPAERGTAQPAPNPQAAPQRTGQPAATPSTPAQPGQAERRPARATDDAPDAERPNAERRAREQRGADDPARAAQPGERGPNEPVRGASPGPTPNSTPGSTPNSAPGAAPDATPPRAASPTAPGGASPNRNTATPATPGTQPGAPAAAGQTDPAAPNRTGQRPENGAVEPQQREVLDTVRRQVEQRNLRPATNIGVTIETGVTLPSRVQVHELPPEIARVRPQYRDYGFVVTEEETVIVDPRTRRVVEVIGRNPGRGGLGPDEVVLYEDVERRSARPWRDRRVEIRRDVVLPREAPLYELPPAYVERAPRYRGHRYVVTEDEVAIVEPRSRRVVEVIQRDELRQRSAQAQGGAGRAPQGQARAPETTGSLGLTEDDRIDIARTLLRRSEPGSLVSIRELRGAVLPETLDLQRLPRSLTERTPELRDFSYVLMGDDVLLVEPDTRRVVDVLR